jgi:sialidase-1
MGNIGKIVLELKPSIGNPRNSEGAFYTINGGHILFIYSKFCGDTDADDGNSCIACRESFDLGETWSEDKVLFRSEDHKAKNIMSVSLLPMTNGNIGLFYNVKLGWHDTRLHLRCSSDQGITWSNAVPCMPVAGYYVTNNDRVIRISTGRILIPSNLHRSGNSWDTLDLRGIASIFYSDDDGGTWHESKGCSFISAPRSESGLQESGIIELNSGVIYQWMRTDQGSQYESFSLDCGDTWTIPAPSRFTSPLSPLSMKRVPESGKLLAVWNPIPNYNGCKIGKAGWGRTPLVLATSINHGKSWSDSVVIEDDPEHGYCYTAIHFAGDFVLLAYCAGGIEDHTCLSRSVIRRIKLSELP